MSKPRRKWPWVVGGTVALLVIAGVAGGEDEGVNVTPDSDPPTASPSSTTVTSPEVRPTTPAQWQPAPPVERQPHNDRDGSGTVYYKNCDAAQSAGAAPIKRDEPGYRPGLDRDNDGTACE